MLEIDIEKVTGQHIDDRTLLDLISQGDEAALATLYARHGGKLYGYALKVLQDPAAAEDVLQESLITIWQKAKSFRGEGRVIAWMFGIVHYKSMRTYRERKADVLDETTPDPKTVEKLVNDRLISQERKKVLRAGLEKLSVEHRTVLELVFYHEMSMKEISQICKVPVGTVKSRLNYAKAALKGVLSRRGMTMEDLK